MPERSAAKKPARKPVRTVESRGAVVEFQVLRKGRVIAQPGFSMVAAACGGVSALDLVSQPTAVMELRGFGGSRVADTKASGLEGYLADFETVIGQARRKQPVLFGYSHAGYFATAYALRKANRLSGLVLVEPALYTDRKELLRRAELAQSGDGRQAIEATMRYVQPEVFERRVEAKVAKTILGHAQGNETLAQEFRLRAEHPIDDKELAALKLPVLLIGGTDSHVAHFVERAARAIPRANVWWVKGAQHGDLQTKKFAAEVSGAVNLFLSSAR